MGVKIINLPDLTGLPETGDYFPVSDGTVTSKLNFDLLAQAVIEDYDGSEIGGAEQAVKTLLDSLQTAVTNMSTVTSELLTITAGTAVITDWRNEVEKCGKMAILQLNFTCSSDVNQRLTVTTLPVGYRPAKEMTCNFVTNMSISGGGNNNYVTIRTNGDVELNPRTGVRLFVPFFTA